MTEPWKEGPWIDPVLQYTADELINCRHKRSIYVSANEPDDKYNNEYLVQLLEKYPGYKTIRVGTMTLVGCVYNQPFEVKFVSSFTQIEDIWVKPRPTLLIFDNQVNRGYYRHMDSNGFKVITAGSSFNVTANNDTENVSKGNTECHRDDTGVTAMDDRDGQRMDAAAQRRYKNLIREPRIAKR